VALYVIVVIIFVFAQALVRKRAYSFFWITHQLYVLLYVLSVLHGLARLTAAPRFWLFLIVPGVIYAIDKIATLRTR
jgi:dual oxidase